MIAKSISDAKEWASAQALSEGGSQRSKLPPSALFFPQPSRGQTVCHVDAAWDPNSGNCGFGGLFSGTEGVLIPTIKDSRSYVWSALMGEAIAVRSAVMTASSSNVYSLIVLSDSQVLINLIKSKESSPELFDILFDIYHFSLSFDVISFHFIPRLCNGAADEVAKSALATLNSSLVDGE